MDDTQIAEGLRACEAATPGPWAWEQYGEKENAYHIGVALNREDKPQQGRVVSMPYVEDGDVFVEDILWHDNIGQQEGATVHYDDADFICHARGNADGTTGYAAALRENEIGRREFAVIRNAYLVLLKGVQDWVGNTNSCMALPGDLDNGCEMCPQCDLAVLVADTAPAAPPFAEEAKEERCST